MKKTKKLVALVVTILMLATFATSTFPVFAETSSSSRYTVKVEGEEPIYEGNLLNEAAAKAVTTSGAVVYLNEDVALSELTQDEKLLDVGSDQALVIDGNGFSLTAGGRGWFIRFNGVSNASVTFRNFNALTFQATTTDIGTKGSNITVNFEDINILNFDAPSYGVGTFDGNATVTVNFSDIGTVNSVGVAVVYTNNGKNTVNVTNVECFALNSADTTKGEAGFAHFVSQTANAEIVVNLTNSHLIARSGYGVAYKGVVTAASGATATVDVDGESSITTEKMEGRCVWVQGASTLNLRLEENARLITNCSTSSGGFVGMFEAVPGTLNIEDNGAIYTVGADQFGTVTFPTGDGVYVEQLEEGATGAANVVMAGGIFENTTGHAISFKKATIGEGAFANKIGASIRTETPYGIRFTATMDKTLYDMLLARGATFGIVIAPYKYVEGFENSFFKKLTDQPESYYADVVCENVTVNGNVVEFKAAVYIAGNEDLTGVSKAQLTADMCACSYYTVDGTTTWAEFSTTDNIRSIYDVAVGYYEDTVKGSTENATINRILETCGYFADEQ